MLVKESSVEMEVIWKSLRARTLANRNNSRLLRVKHATLFAHGLRVGDGGREEAIPGHPAVESCPVIVPVWGMGQAPWDEGVFLLVRVDAFLLAGSAMTHTAKGTVLAFALKTVKSECFICHFNKSSKCEFIPISLLSFLTFQTFTNTYVKWKNTVFLYSLNID